MGLGEACSLLFFVACTPWGAALGFCFVSALAIVQACMVANGIAESRGLNSNVRNAFEELKRNSEISYSFGYVCAPDRPSNGTDRIKE